MKQLSRLVKKKGVGQGSLTYEQGVLVIDLGGVSFEAAAEGDFPRRVRISGLALLKLANVLPDDDPVILKIEDDRLFIGSLSLPIQHTEEEQAGGKDEEHIPHLIETPLYFLLGLEYRYSDDAIIRSGYWEKVNEARGEKERLIQAASYKLSPLGVTKTDVAEMVEKAIRRINGI